MGQLHAFESKGLELSVHSRFSTSNEFKLDIIST